MQKYRKSKIVATKSKNKRLINDECQEIEHREHEAQRLEQYERELLENLRST